MSRVIVWNSNNAPFEGQSLSVNDIGGVNLGYPGQYYEEAGLYNLNREYDETYGRYTQADPIGLAGGIDPYVYAGNNPVSNVDPLGLCNCSSPTPPSRLNNPNLNRNMILGVGAVGIVGAVGLNILAFPEAQVAEGAAAISFISVGGMQGTTAIALMDGLAGEPIISGFITSFSGLGMGSLPGGLLGFGITQPLPSPTPPASSSQNTDCP